MIAAAEQSFSPLRKTSGSEALLDVFFFLDGRHTWDTYNRTWKKEETTNTFEAL